MATMAAKPMQTIHNRHMPSRYYPLVLIVCALAAAIVADRCLSVRTSTWWIVALASLTVWTALWLLRRDWISSWLLLAGALAVGGAWHHAWWRLYAADELGRMVQEDARPLCIEAIAIQSPRWVPAPPP